MKKWTQLAVLTIYLLAGCIMGMFIRSGKLLAGEQPDLSRYLLTKPQVLFSLQYGEGPSQIGMFIPHPTAVDAGEPMGPSDFAIGFDGSIYIGDEQNGKVKKFSRDGKLLMVTAGRIDRIAGMTVDKRGWIYVIHGTLSNEVAVYDEKGRRLPEAEGKIMGAAKRLAKELAATQPQLEKEIFGGWGGLPAGAVRCDAVGNLYFVTGFNCTVKIDADFTQAQVIRGYPYPRSAGLWYAYRLLPAEKRVVELVYGTDGSLINKFLMNILRRAEVIIYRADGSVMRKFILPKGEWSELEKLVPIGVSDIFCDKRGHFYTLWSPVVSYHQALKPDNPRFFVVRYDALMEYDEEGNFVGVRAVINGFTMPSIHWIEVDSHGNIYWLDFKADHLDVMMAPVPKSHE